MADVCAPAIRKLSQRFPGRASRVLAALAAVMGDGDRQPFKPDPRLAPGVPVQGVALVRTRHSTSVLRLSHPAGTHLPPPTSYAAGQALVRDLAAWRGTHEVVRGAVLDHFPHTPHLECALYLRATFA